MIRYRYSQKFFSPSITQSFIFSTFLFCLIQAIGGCKSKETLVDTSHKEAFQTHLEVDDSILKNANRQGLLLVSLKPFLGSSLKEHDQSKPLILKSHNGNLILRDLEGVIHKSSEITVIWRKMPLQSPQKISRQVFGPFSSFESAEKFALELKQKGVKTLIAHPSDWEVWISSDTSLNTEKSLKTITKVINSEIRPVLKGKTGEILLKGPIKIEAPNGLRWKGGVYSGPFFLKADAYGTWTLLEKVSLEKYLQGVVPHEIGASSPPAALAAQSVLARTWALANSHRFAIDGYNLCSDTQCQVYKDPSKINSNVKEAIEKTTGKILKWSRKPIHAVYHASNGGVMASAHEAWAISTIPYLRARLDGSKELNSLFKLPIKKKSTLISFLSQKEHVYGKYHPRFRWKRTLTSDQLKNSLRFLRTNIASPRSIEVIERGPSGRVVVLGIFFKESNQSPIFLRLDSIRRNLRTLPSTLFVVEKVKEDLWQFTGGGFGHGAGLSQAGAIDLAKKGWSTTEILKHYYPGTKYESLR